jgi:hypothetical protein
LQASNNEKPSGSGKTIPDPEMPGPGKSGSDRIRIKINYAWFKEYRYLLPQVLYRTKVYNTVHVSPVTVWLTIPVARKQIIGKLLLLFLLMDTKR